VAGVGLKKRADHYPPVLHWSRFLMRPVRDAPAIMEIPSLESGRRIKTSRARVSPLALLVMYQLLRRFVHKEQEEEEEYARNTRFLRLERPSGMTHVGCPIDLSRSARV